MQTHIMALCTRKKTDCIPQYILPKNWYTGLLVALLKTGSGLGPTYFVNHKDQFRPIFDQIFMLWPQMNI